MTVKVSRVENHLSEGDFVERRFLFWPLALLVAFATPAFVPNTWAAQETATTPAKQEKDAEANPAAEKQDEAKQEPPKKPTEFAARFNERFLKSKPLIGETVSGLKAYDEKGNPIDLNDRKGKHAVLVFGCLT